MKKENRLLIMVFVITVIFCGCGTIKNKPASAISNIEVPAETITPQEMDNVTITPQMPDQESITPQVPVQESQNSEVTTSTMEFSDQQMADLFKLNQEEVFDLYGRDYKIVYIGEEATFKGYRYDNGLTFVFDDAGCSIVRIECMDNIYVEGSHCGVKFCDIMKVLGENEVILRTDNTNERIYDIRYDRSTGLRYYFKSNYEDGTESELVIAQFPPA